MDTTAFEAIVTGLAGLLLAAGVLGTVFPILPGSLLTIGTLLVWAWLLGSTASWTAGLVGVGLAVIGMSASLILTGRKMRRERIPNGPVRDAVLLNTAAGLTAYDKEASGHLFERMQRNIRRAEQSIDSGAAQQVLDRWVKVSRPEPEN